MKNYYGLVASMPDVSPDDAKLNFTVADFKGDYWRNFPRQIKSWWLCFSCVMTIAICWHGWPGRQGGVRRTGDVSA